MNSLITQKKMRWHLLLMLAVLLNYSNGSYASSFSEENSDDICNASFTYELDSAGSTSYSFEPEVIDQNYDYSWSIDGQTVSNSSLLNYTFADSGAYEVSLRVFNTVDTCSSSQTVVVIDDASDSTYCNAEFVYTVDSTNILSYSFYQETTTGEEKGYEWSIDGQTVSNSSLLNYTFADSGAYEVSLRVFNAVDTCSSSQTVVIIDDASDSTYCNAEFTYTVDSTNTLSYSFYPIVTTDEEKGYEWSIDGQTVSNSSILNYMFADSGAYEVSFSVFNASDTCSSSQTVIAIDDVSDSTSCNAEFVYTVDSTNTLSYSFYQETTTGEEKGYEWSIDGQTVSNSSLLNYTFADSGAYEVSLRVFNAVDTCSSSQTVVVIDDASDSTYCNAEFTYTVDSTNTLSYSFYPIVTTDEEKGYEWSLDGQIMSNSSSLNYEFADNGAYEVSLRIFNAVDTCSSSQTIYVESEADSLNCNLADFTYAVDSSNSLSYQFSPVLIDEYSYYSWSIDGSFVSNSSTLHYVFSDSGAYEVAFSVFDELDTCSSSQTVYVELPSDTVTVDSLYIKGKLFADVVPIDGILRLYKQEDGQWNIHAEVNSVNGDFEFSALSQGTYLVYARGDEDLHSSFIPTYFVNGVGWEDAFTFDVTSPLEGVEITLIKFSAMSVQGSGNVRGKLVEESEEQVVLLKDQASGAVLEWTVSASGDHSFDFSDVPYGDYSVTMEKPSGSITEYFTLSSSQPSVDLSMEATDVLGLDDLEDLNTVSVYPSSFEGFFTIENTSMAEEELTIILRSLTGKVIVRNQVKLGYGEAFIQTVPLSVNSGMKLLQIINSNGEQKVVKLIRR